MDKPLVPGMYRHYKGDIYQVYFAARHTETHDPLVICQLIHGDMSYWATPLWRFLSLVKVKGNEVPRFEFIGDVDYTL